MMPVQEEIDWSKLTISADPNKIYKLQSPPSPNWSIFFGSKSAFCFMIHTMKPPNKFQRWMLRKFFGMTWENMESK